MFNIENRRYIGSKTKLIDRIEKEIKITKKEYTSFADIFAGTGVVAQKLSHLFDNIIVNDILYSNYCIYNAFFGTQEIDIKRLEEFIEEKNNKCNYEICETFFSKIYADTYFDKETTLKIGEIREEINGSKFNEREKDVLISSLIYSIDRCANTVGHYESFFKSKKNFREFKYEMINTNNEGNYKIYREDANVLVKKIEADVIYIDPPYNSRQYSRFYHLLETLVKWEEFDPMGKALKPPLENLSEYSRSGAVDSFSNLINDINAKLIIVSYNDTYNSTSSSSNNKIKYKQIINILSKKGKVKIREIEHKHFNAGITKVNNNKEYLFVCEVNNA